MRGVRVTITFLWGGESNRGKMCYAEKTTVVEQSHLHLSALYLSSKTKIISPLLKVSSLSSTASKSYRARTFLRLWGFCGISADGYKDLVSICCCFCSCKDNSIAAGGAQRKEQVWGGLSLETKQFESLI